MSHTDICVCIFIWLENVMPVEFSAFQIHASLGLSHLSYMHGMQDKQGCSIMYVYSVLNHLRKMI